ncbi:MAG: phosphatidylserine/phosphatidylglycerophosphate/cardiolipin synthase family protein [Deltaproteobacteria bacterium]|nr:MAG: phosphatidylserine/phosphatidylglycerophosphate/cardiolipin synthase family protein [Deltaproteobacteria bacterium]
MKASKLISLLAFGLIIAILAAAVRFFFNPLGLGPEPEAVLSVDFFARPAKNLSPLELLVGGGEAFDEMLESIDSAASSIHVQTYIWKDDNMGRKMLARLKTAASRGVKVTISKDILGTVFELGDLLHGKPSPVFTKAGLKGYANINVHLSLFADTDHSKYVIVDERLVIFGGMNIADEYHTDWHDYMALIRSSRWAKAFQDKVLSGSSWPHPSPFVVTVNNRKATEIRTALIEMIDNSRESVILEHAYFSDDKVIAAIERAAARGVNVTIILPEEPDTHLYANMVTINRLLGSAPEDNLKILLYPQMSHAKVALTDGKIAAIGSANLTPRSMLTSREVTLFVHGAHDDLFINELQERLVADMAESEQVLEPYQLSFTDKVKALVGKYVW